MDEYTDAWFVGFDPDITVGVWVGYDEKKTLGDDGKVRGSRFRSGWTSCVRLLRVGTRQKDSGHLAILCFGPSIP